MEVNGRLWGSVQLAVDCGVDVPWLMYQLATGIDPAPVLSYEVGRRSRWFVGDLSHLYLVLRGKSIPHQDTSRMSSMTDVLWRHHINQFTEDWRYGDRGPFWHQIRRELRLGSRNPP